jgi:dihydrofolate reductase
MKLSLIWAMTDERVIGIENSLPWKLPADMKWFRQHTLGKPIIMGRKTFESFGAKPLPQRLNIIVSKDSQYRAQDAVVVGSIAEAVEKVKDVEEVMVIGGASLYAQTLPLAQRLYMTLVHANIKGDAWFPEFDLNQWQEIERQEHAADEKNPFAYTFLILEKTNEATVNTED